MGAAALASSEVFKASMMRLLPWALNRDVFNARFAPCLRAGIELAPADTPQTLDLEDFDVVSGGAIANAFLYSIRRLRGARGSGRVIDFDDGDITNLNRNMLMRYSDVGIAKVQFLAERFSGPLKLIPEALRFDGPYGLKRPSARMVVGVDHIPTRWLAQACNPLWLGIGASSHWSAMASYHARALACARCLHPVDDPDQGPVPTVAFVSFWAGLLLSGYFAQSLANRQDAWPQQTYLTPLRPELPWRSSVARRPDCPLCAAQVKRVLPL